MRRCHRRHRIRRDGAALRSGPGGEARYIIPSGNRTRDYQAQAVLAGEEGWRLCRARERSAELRSKAAPYLDAVRHRVVPRLEARTESDKKQPGGVEPRLSAALLNINGGRHSRRSRRVDGSKRSVQHATPSDSLPARGQTASSLLPVLAAKSRGPGLPTKEERP